MVTIAHVASSLIVLQSFDIEVCYAQSKKNPLGTDLAACQQCTEDIPLTSPAVDPLPVLKDIHHQYINPNICKDMVTDLMEVNMNPTVSC